MGFKIKKVKKGAMYKNRRVYEEDELIDGDCDKKNLLVKAIVTISTGKKFYVDPVSRADIADAINIAIDTNQTSTIWKLAEAIDGTKLVTVSLDELKEARLLGLQYKGSLVGV